MGLEFTNNNYNNASSIAPGPYRVELQADLSFSYYDDVRVISADGASYLDGFMLYRPELINYNNGQD